MTDALDLDALEALEKASTPIGAGWSVYEGDFGKFGKDAKGWSIRVVYSFGDDELRCTAWPAICACGAQPNETNARFIASLRNAAPALIALARRAQQDAAREGTHAPDCHLWGRRHYDCLLGKYEASRAEIARLRQALEAAG